MLTGPRSERHHRSGDIVMRRAAVAVTCVWVLWTQTRISGPAPPIRDVWQIVDTFPTQAACESARVAIDPPAANRPAANPPEAKPETARSSSTRYVCFPDTLDPRATP
jgi:hypothetical protein